MDSARRSWHSSHMETERGHLVFESGEADVDCWINRDEQGRLRGRITHSVGHPHWNPIISLNPGPFILVMSNGRKLKVVLENLQGSFRGMGDFF
jgi:hypothetical protein